MTTENELPQTSETLEAIENLFASMESRASKLFRILLTIDQEKYPVSHYKDPYTYDNFVLEYGRVLLKGSYSYRYDSGSIEFPVSYEAFFGDKFMDAKEKEIETTKQETPKRIEYENELKLAKKEKFGGKE